MSTDIKCRQEIIFGDNTDVLPTIEANSIDLIYIDPPFNTGKTQRSARTEGLCYNDTYDYYIEFIRPHLIEAWRVLKEDGSIFVHLDYREVHYVKILLDQIFGRNCFMNEIIWVYDFGGRPKNKWPCKHDTILWYVENQKNYCFNFESMDRIPYMAPGLCGPEKAARGKTPTDCWWNTIVHTSGKERTGYPTQKPLAILERIIKVHSDPNDIVLDFFAGSGTTGEAAKKLGRQYILIDNNPDAIEIMKKRLGHESNG